MKLYPFINIFRSKRSKFILLLYLILSGKISFAQKSDEDILVDISINLRNRNTDSSYIALQKLLKRNKKSLLNTRIKAVLGRQYFNNGKIDSAKIFLQQAINEISLRKDSMSQVRLSSYYYNLGNCNREIGLNDKALKNYLTGLSIAEKINNKEYTIINTNGIGLYYSSQREYDKAIEYLNYCIENELDTDKSRGYLINLASVYGASKRYSKEIDIYKKILKTDNLDSYTKLVVSLNIGVAYHELKDYKEAIYYYNKAKEIAKKQNKQLWYLRTLFNEAIIYHELEDFTTAKLLFNKALHTAKELKNLMFEREIYSSLKNINAVTKDWKNAYTTQKNYYLLKDSIQNLQKSKEITELKIKYETAQKEKEITKLRFYNKQQQLRAKNKEISMAKLITEKKLKEKEKENEILQLTNATEKKQNQILKLKEIELIQENEIKKQKSIKQIVLIAFIVILIPISILLLVYYQKLKTQHKLNLKTEEMNQQNIASLIREQELKLIKASIEGQNSERQRIAQELHDQIGGNLSAIKLQFSDFKHKNKIYNKVTQQIDDTYQLVRDLSHNMIPKKFIDYPFTKLIEEYIYNITSEDQQISFDPYPKEDINKLKEKTQIEIYSIIQELLTNIIKHARASKIDIQLHLLEKMIKIIVEDNGVGFNTQKKNTGIGLQNIKSRLDIFNGILHIDSEINRGTIIDIDIPIHS